jgi:hypothetical protein
VDSLEEMRAGNGILEAVLPDDRTTFIKPEEFKGTNNPV